MEDIKFGEILAMQRTLQELHAHEWTPKTPEAARSYLLWMVEEVGEVIAIMKKKGDAAIAEPGPARTHFVEELCDVLMYFGDVMNCYGITEAELASAFRTKHAYNMQRDYKAQADALYSE